MKNSQFEELVRQALQQLPEKIRHQMDNIDLVVEKSASDDQLAYSVIRDGKSLLGLYEGIPLTEREDYGMVLPDKISIFQDSIEEVCTTNEEIVQEVINTVVHEVAHHFGIEDQTLDNIGI